MERGIGSVGSECQRFHIDPEVLPLFKDFDWNRLARRVFIDPVTGVIALIVRHAKSGRQAMLATIGAGR